jgi:hypothetical protein
MYYCGVTRRSIKVPLSSFTLLFSELNTEAAAAFVAVVSFRFEIPTTPRVSAVIFGFAKKQVPRLLGIARKRAIPLRSE